jgi:hypothetical protein
MCDLCLLYPCHPGCPNAPEPPVVCECSQCGEPIYEGDAVYDIHDEKWCESCIEDCRSEAELYEPNYYELEDEI